MDDDSELLVVALTRPTMLGGLTMTSLGLSIYLPGVLTFVTKSVWGLLLLPILLLISYLVCLRDVYLFEVALAATRLRACRNKRLWGFRSYAPR